MESGIKAEKFNFGRLWAILLVSFIFIILADQISDYLLFHSVVELFSVVVGFSIFIVAWNSRKFLDNNFFLFLGIAYFFIAVLDLLHTLAYSGMGVFPGYSSGLATQLWIAARYMQAFTLLISSFLLVPKSKRINSGLILVAYFVITFIIILSIFQWKNFPVVYVDGTGLTAFKKISEYIICLILAVSVVVFYKRKEFLSKNVFYLIVLSVIVTIFSELSFTLYVGVYDYFNRLGHILRAIAFFVFYLGVIETGIQNPQTILFRNLKEREESLKKEVENKEKIEKKLMETKEYLDNLINYASAPIIVWDNDYKITRFNYAFEHLTGRLADEVIGKHLDILFPEESKKESMEYIYSAAKGNRWESVEIPIKNKNKSVYTVLWNSAGIYDFNKKNIVATIAQGQDITKRKEAEKKNILYALQMEEDKARDEALLESLKDGIAAVDKEGKVIFMNHGFEYLTGYSRVDLIGKDFVKIIKLLDEKGNEVPDDERPGKTILSSGKAVFKKNFMCVRKDGRPVSVSITATPILLKKEIIGAVFDYVDVTEERETDRAKTEFASLASHQLRTPLTSLSLAAELLFPDISADLGKEEKKYLKIINESIKEMKTLTEELLNISRIEMGTLGINPEPTDIKEFVDDLSKNFLIQLSEKSLKLKKRIDPALPAKISIDQKITRQIFDNLISNAIKYNKLNGEIGVEVTKNKEEVVVGVSDTGYGIPKSQYGQVFKKFFRSDNILKFETKGTGLGLYIVKSLVEQCGGRVWFESTEGVGSEFFFSIPLKGVEARKGKLLEQ